MKKHPNKKILVTGHSLGAAMAQYCAMEVVRYAKEVKYGEKMKSHGVYVYTFGSPRWANKEMANYFNTLIDTHYRVVHKKDVVPVLPPRYWSGYLHLGPTGYIHTGTEIWYTHDNPLKYIQCDGSGYDKKCVSGASGMLHMKTGVEDHLTYIGITTGQCTKE